MLISIHLQCENFLFIGISHVFEKLKNSRIEFPSDIRIFMQNSYRTFHEGKIANLTNSIFYLKWTLLSELLF